MYVAVSIVELLNWLLIENYLTEFDEKEEVGTDVTQQWEDDWDDDDVNDDFSLQLRRELVDNSTEKK